jgi:hypothetical protein
MCKVEARRGVREPVRLPARYRGSPSADQLLEFLLRPTIRLAAPVLALLLAAPAAMAQPQGGPAQSGGQPDLSSILHLRPDQQGPYHAYMAAGPQPDEVAKFRAAQNLGSLTTPERLDRIGAALAVQQTIFHRKADATRAFYNVLSPDQKHTFDQLTAPRPRGAQPPQG